MFSHSIATSEYHHGNTSAYGPKFFRRHDLTPLTRFFIAVKAFIAKNMDEWGMVTRLSRQFLISRTFIY